MTRCVTGSCASPESRRSAAPPSPSPGRGPAMPSPTGMDPKPCSGYAETGGGPPPPPPPGLPAAAAYDEKYGLSCGAGYPPPPPPPFPFPPCLVPSSGGVMAGWPPSGPAICWSSPPPPPDPAGS